jgi:hypothetical protein
MDSIERAEVGAGTEAEARGGLPCFGFLEGREVAEEDLGDLGAAGLLGFFGSHASKEADGEGALAEDDGEVGFLSHSLREACEEAEADAEAEAEVAAADVDAALRSSVEPFRFVCFGMFAWLLYVYYTS